MSIWKLNENKDKKLVLDKDIDVDTLIIGAGMTGMNIAYKLKNTSSLCIVDASSIGHGVTYNTTAKLTYLQGDIYKKIILSKNEDAAKLYLNSQIDAINDIKKIIEKEKIECNFENVPSYLFASTKKEIDTLKQEIKFLKKNKINIKEGNLPDKITSYKSYFVSDTYIFHPLKYLNGLYKILIKNIPIYENTKILKITEENGNYLCFTNKYHIKAKKVILACHYPFFLFPFFLPIKSYIEKSYIVVSRVKENKGYSCINTSNPTYSCRFYNDGKSTYQISLAESHNTSFKQDDKYHFKRVKEIFNLKKEDIVMSYSNVDIITPDNMPYIGKIKDNMYIATGFNTWGMTNSILSSQIIFDLINNNQNKYKDIFNPKRLNFVKIPYIAFSQIKSFIGPKIIKNKSWYNNNIKFDGEVAIYIDKNNIEHKVINKCPHLGCSLIFNELEKTWDCPCHSSRFDIDGKCIKGPSKYDISYNNEEKED